MTTVAYTVRKEALRSCLNVRGLKNLTEYVGVYVLRNLETDTLYVGQVGDRENGFIGRMLEHKRNDVGDNDWDIAYMFLVETPDGDGIKNSSVNLDALESQLRWYVDRLADCRTKVTKDHAVLNDTGMKILEDIKLYLMKFLPEYFEITEEQSKQVAEIKDDTTEIKLNVRNLGNYNDVKDITTPKKWVDELVNKIPEEYFTVGSKFLDLACKDGLFLSVICERLMSSKSLQEAYPNINTRYNYIVNEQLYGIALSDYSYELASDFLYGDHDRVRNIHRADDNYIARLKNRAIAGSKDNLSLIDYIKINRQYIFNNILKVEFDSKNNKRNKGKQSEDMKFDVIIGNPPYSDDTQRAHGSGGSALYPYFMYLGSELAYYSSMIVPSGWMLQMPSSIKPDVVRNLRQNKRYMELHDFYNSQRVFNGVGISNGVCYYTMDSKEHDTCNHYIYKYNAGDPILVDNMPLYNEDLGVIFRDPCASSIVPKIRERVYKLCR